jgi:hypothetical protein
MLILAILVLSYVTLAEPAFAIVPTVEKVVPYNVGSSTYLNITVHHFPQDTTPHYVNTIKVTMGTNVTQLTISLQPVSAPYYNFIIQYDLGPVIGNPTINVDAHCIVNGWASASEQNWIGQIPEFQLPALLLTLVLVTSAVVFVVRRAKPAK